MRLVGEHRGAQPLQPRPLICDLFFKRNTGGPEHTNRHQHRKQTNAETEHRPNQAGRKERVKQESPTEGRAGQREPAKSEAEARRAFRESETKVPREDEGAFTHHAVS